MARPAEWRRFSVVLRADDFRRLEELAAEHDASVGWLLRRAVKAYLEQAEPKPREEVKA